MRTAEEIREFVHELKPSQKGGAFYNGHRQAVDAIIAFIEERRECGCPADRSHAMNCPTNGDWWKR